MKKPANKKNIVLKSGGDHTEWLSNWLDQQ